MENERHPFSARNGIDNYSLLSGIGEIKDFFVNIQNITFEDQFSNLMEKLLNFSNHNL
jgi:hypothetical protein